MKDFGSNSNLSGRDVSGSLSKANNGKLYGITSGGGDSSAGVIFSFNPSSLTYTKRKDFTTTTGSNPYGSLIQSRYGKLYGMTSTGGSNNYGVIFSFAPSTSTYTKLMDFDGAQGRNPSGSVLEASDGKLYGMTAYGGSVDKGVIFSFDPTSLTYTKLKDFDNTNGAIPIGNLIQADNGKLYGMTSEGGINGNGVIFSFDPSTLTYANLKNFDEVEGRWPKGSLMQASDGKLYGMTEQGGVGVGCIGDPEGGCKSAGVIFSFDPIASTFKKLVNFDGINGLWPKGNLMQASDGKLYGMTSAGGSTFDPIINNDDGVIFSYDPSSSIFMKLKEYNGTNGANPGVGSTFIEVKDSIVNIPPSVSLTTPSNKATYLADGDVYLKAIASDSDGTISKLDFYNDTNFLFTATDTPYAFKWEHVSKGNYILLAKATDNTGMVTTSDSVHISVVPNKPPTVSIINPANGKTFLKGATVHLQAAASDADGMISKVEFYVGATLIVTEHKLPYTFDYRIGETGNYIFTAKATDNWGR